MDEKHKTALSAGLVAFIATLLVIAIIDVCGFSTWIEYVGGLFVALLTAAAIELKQRLDERKKDSRRRDG